MMTLCVSGFAIALALYLYSIADSVGVELDNCEWFDWILAGA